ncbi:MAG TPA: hypothetical protein VIK35_04610 [Verrucomicrobiae bacterium]
MKLFKKSEIPLILGILLSVIGTFDKPFGLPSDFRFAFLLSGLLVLSLNIYFTLKRKKSRPETQTNPATIIEKQKRFCFLISLYAISFAVMPFVFPLISGQKIAFADLLAYSVIGFFFCAGLTWIVIKKKN